ncbi:3-deoxy-D-manno-octulosonic-acid transferase [Deferribacter desulfuricans SSM1]|uniref:3-deoxy-D-manno-octulosonic acid transferase n=1 Tax=Deferribacter desulfuricans (strain DSM 14783 / JCM 11476 / NBRC 101012 / SSM1) TaxID=639282 RepID=D3PAM5_DEFDS|nr:glycosyltransferase N-terminal domain-containing protein [Deferribacter desulfuricans]BAI79648.1 3-deoxy-D-manno-octulosonic-acid transferase [Deferribacter desulfuricans SSM1]
MTILKIIYNLLIFILIPFIVPLGYLAALWKKEEKDYFERFGFIKIDKEIEKSIWFHCASVGEVRSLKVLVDEIRKRFPDLSIVVTTVTYSGKEIAIKELKPDVCFLLPIENSFAIRYLIQLLNTKLFFIVDTEIWPNLIITASKETSLVMINGRISDRSFKSYYKLKFIFKYLLTRFDKIFVKSEDDYIKFKKILEGEENLELLGNLKFFVKKDVEIDELEFLKGNFFTAGSTHRGEEELVLNAFGQVKDKYDKLIIVPRHLNRVDEVYKIIKNYDYSVAKWSEGEDKILKSKVILVDKFGMLEKFYKISSKIFVGGSVVNNIGGHNIFESLQFRKVIGCGENMWNFKEIYDLAKKYNLIYTVKNKEDFESYLKDEVILNCDFDGFENELNNIAKNKISKILDFIDRKL